VALAVARARPDDLLVFLPCDHHYRDDAAFRRALVAAIEHARGGGIGLLGVVPTRAETGFGYLELGPAVGSARLLRAFREKPALDVAQRLVAQGDCWWNAGVFVGAAAAFAEALERTQPAFWAAVRSGGDWAPWPGGSFDHAVLERLEPAGPVARWAFPLDAGFSDLGHWGALEDLAPPDASGNVALGEVDLLDCEGVLAYAEDGRIAALGLQGLILVRSGWDVLVCPRSRAQEVRRLAERARQEVR
jgi:mannose-1-phosphate guanylyltransferase/mannose-6-phosphate isomerase